MQTEIKAVIPAAGLGSRMLPMTKSVPKEMLPVGRKPMIQHFAQATTAISQRGVLLQGEPLDLGTFKGYYRYLPRLSGAEE